jgi:hypothetical protein
MSLELTVRVVVGFPSSTQIEVSLMKTTQLTLAILLATGIAAAPFAAEARSHKKHHMAKSSQSTTGANMKSGDSANPSSQGNVGPGTNQAGSMSAPAK